MILVGAYQPVATLIAWARHLGWNPVFITISFVGSNALTRELGPAGTGVFVTQVVPFPNDDTLPVVLAYRRALAAYDAEATPGFVSLEGYLAGRLAIFALERCGPEVDRARFLESFRRAGLIDLGGFALHYGEDDKQGSDAVFLTAIGSDGAYYPINSLREAMRP